jgi:hypothetical protein
MSGNVEIEWLVLLTLHRVGCFCDRHLTMIDIDQFERFITIEELARLDAASIEATVDGHRRGDNDSTRVRNTSLKGLQESRPTASTADAVGNPDYSLYVTTRALTHSSNRPKRQNMLEHSVLACPGPI